MKSVAVPVGYVAGAGRPALAYWCKVAACRLRLGGACRVLSVVARLAVLVYVEPLFLHSLVGPYAYK